MEDIYEEIFKLKARGEGAALATLISTIGSTPREQGAKMLIRQDGSIVGTVGGSILEGKVREEAQGVLREGKPKVLQFDLTGQDKDGMICGGKAEVFIEPIVPSPTLYIFGGGHISFYLARIGKMVGFRVVVIDDREEYANPERFPDAAETIAGEYQDVFSRIPVNQGSYLVIVTRGHAHDQTVLEWAMKTSPKYLGMIGSRKKIRTLYERMAAKGFSPEELTKQVYAPIGLDIKAETPEEIAVSIIAEVIKVRRSEEVRNQSASCPA